MVGTADRVLIREVSFIQSVLYGEVSLYACMCTYVHMWKLSLYVFLLDAHHCPPLLHTAHTYLLCAVNMLLQTVHAAVWYTV